MTRTTGTTPADLGIAAARADDAARRITIDEENLVEGLRYSGWRSCYAVRDGGELVAFFGFLAGFGRGWMIQPIQIANEGMGFEEGYSPQHGSPIGYRAIIHGDAATARADLPERVVELREQLPSRAELIAAQVARRDDLQAKNDAFVKMLIVEQRKRGSHLMALQSIGTNRALLAGERAALEAVIDRYEREVEHYAKQLERYHSEI